MPQRKTSRKASSKRRTSSPSMKKSAASRTTKSSTTRSSSHTSKGVGDQEVTIDRRRAPRRREQDAVPATQSPVAPPKLERRQKVNRRRQIDPTTCERDYTGDEIEFMNALDDYKRKSGRMFPTCSEVLEVVRSLGYAKLAAADLAAGQFGSASMSAGSATTRWSADDADQVDDEEEAFEAALAD